MQSSSSSAISRANTARSKIRRVVPSAIILSCALILLDAPPASAQQCEGGDLFSSARRARRAVEDRQILYDYFRRDLDELDRAELMFGIEDPSPVRVYGGPVGQFNIFPAAKICTSRGQKLPGTYQNIRFGLLGGVFYRPWNIGLEVFSTFGNDTAIANLPSYQSPPAADPRDEEESAGEDEILEGLNASAGQEVLGARVQITEWFAFGVGRIAHTFSQQSRSEEVIATRAAPDADQLMLWIEIPKLGISTDLLAPKNSRALSTAFFHVAEVPITRRLTLGGQAGYLRDESRGYALVDVGFYPNTRFEEQIDRAVRDDEGVLVDLGYDMVTRRQRGWRIGLDASAETHEANFRHVRASLKRQMRQATSHQESTAQLIMRAPYADLGAEASLSLFHGQQMRAVTGKEWATGARAHAWLGFGTRIMSVHVDLGGSINQPEVLGRTSELVDAFSLDVALNWRVGW